MQIRSCRARAQAKLQEPAGQEGSRSHPLTARIKLTRQAPSTRTKQGKEPHRRREVCQLAELGLELGQLVLDEAALIAPPLLAMLRSNISCLKESKQVVGPPNLQPCSCSSPHNCDSAARFPLSHLCQAMATATTLVKEAPHSRHLERSYLTRSRWTIQPGYKGNIQAQDSLILLRLTIQLEPPILLVARATKEASSNTLRWRHRVKS